MTNQEQYELICEKAKKYDRLVEVQDKIWDEIREDYTMWEGTEFGDGIEYCWRIICKHWKEQE